MECKMKFITLFSTLIILLSVVAPLGVSASNSVDSDLVWVRENDREFSYFDSNTPYVGAYYNQLNNDEMKLYNLMNELVRSQQEGKIKLDSEITFTTQTANPTQAEIDAAMEKLNDFVYPVFYAFMWDNPLIFVYDSYRYGIDTDNLYHSRHGDHYDWSIQGVTFEFILDADYEDNPQSYIDAVSNKVNSFTTTYTNRYGILKDIHDYLCRNVVYDLNAKYAHEPYGALIAGKAVCEGYAEAFKLLCDKYNIPCALIVGDGISGSSSEPHMWNYVQMENGNWYAVDVTWDDQSSIYYDFFLIGYNTLASHFGNDAFYESHVEEELWNCPDIYSTAYVNPCANGHTPGEWTVTKEATYLEDGERVKRCTVCGEITAIEVIPKLTLPTNLTLKATSKLKLENGFLTGIEEKVTVAELQNEFDGTLTVIGTDEKALASNKYVGTGCKITIDNQLYTIFILGDVNGDGTVGVMDALKIKRIILGTIDYTPEQLKAACVSGKSRPSSMDFFRVKKHILHNYDLFGQN